MATVAPAERAAAPGSGTGNDAPAGKPAATLDSLDSILGTAFRDTAAISGDEPTEEDSEAEDDNAPDDDDEALDALEAEADHDGEPQPQGDESPSDAEQERITRYATHLRGNPRSLTQIPMHRRVQAIAEALRLERDAVAADFRSSAEQAMPQVQEHYWNLGYKAALAESEDASVFAELDAADKEGELQEALGQLLLDDPEKAQRYIAKRRGAKGDGKTTDAPAVSAQIIDRLKADKDALAILIANEQAQPGIYNRTTPQGVAKFEEDAIEALAESKAHKKAPVADPARGDADRRRAAAQDRKDLPRTAAAIARGNGAGGGGDLPNDVNGLLVSGFRQSGKKR